MNDMKDLKEPIELFGYECGEGWWPLVEEAKQMIDEWNESHPDKKEELEFTQVKEKFGELTIYLNFYPDNIFKKLMELSERSLKICELCGSTDNVERKQSHGWIYTLCPECRKKEEDRWNKLMSNYNDGK